MGSWTTEFSNYYAENDCLPHSFQGCQIAVDFFQKVLHWFSQSNKTSLKLDTQEVLFGLGTNKDRKLKEIIFSLPFRHILHPFPKNKFTRV